ncbi:MAG: hypothetical protein JOS17DRAFT_779397 [Linnemannia elongata]|nr:MAG: hypothetical protein JOS17DRAFT_779397 [Linnemannia elongata]
MASSAAPSSSKNVFRLHGVNVLNKNDVDSIARLTTLEKRRAAHIVDERQRRDTMNQLMAELGHLAEGSAADVQAQLELEQSIPNPDGSEKRAIVKSNAITTLRNAIAEIHRLRSEVGLKRLASYKEVLVSYRSSPSSGSSPSRRNKRPEADQFISAPMSTPPPYNPQYHHNQPYHHSEPHLEAYPSVPTIHSPPHSPPNVVSYEYNQHIPPQTSPPLFSTPESLNYQGSISSSFSSSPPSHNLPQQRPNLHQRQQPARQRIYLPWCSHLASSYPPLRPIPPTTAVPQPQPQTQLQSYPHNPEENSSYSSFSSISSSPPHYTNP